MSPRLPSREEMQRARIAEEDTVRQRFEASMERSRKEERERARHHALSVLANTEERIGILIDEEELEEAKEELAALMTAMRRWLESDT